MEEKRIPRICFYHLVYAGRGTDLINEDLDHDRTREVVDLILDRTRMLHDKGQPVEVLTVDNHADGPYTYMRLMKEDPKRAAEVLQLLQMNEGNNSGRGIGCVSWDGSVHADQFWRHHSFGNVAATPVQRDLDRSFRRTLDEAQGEEETREGALCQVSLVGHLRWKLQGSGRSDLRRRVGTGPGLLPH